MSAQARIDALTDDIAQNRVPGGSAFARAAAELIALQVADLPADASAAQVRDRVLTISRWTAETKPSMAVVRNVAELAQALVVDSAEDAETLRKTVDAAMLDYIARSEAALAAIARHAGQIFTDGATVLVHSYSASLETLLRTACAQGVKFTLLVTESRPYRESRRLIEAIANSPTEIVLFSDAAVCVAAERATAALVGADSVFTDGSFANKTGTLPVALACRETGVPLYVATELAKLFFGDADDIAMELRPAAELSDGWTLAESGRVEVWNQFFERVDARFVHCYITEMGPLEPSAMRAAAARLWQSIGLPGAAPTGEMRI